MQTALCKLLGIDVPIIQAVVVLRLLMRGQKRVLNGPCTRSEPPRRDYRTACVPIAVAVGRVAASAMAIPSALARRA